MRYAFSRRTHVKTGYRHVFEFKANATGHIFYRAEKTIKGVVVAISNDTARGAALAMDIKLIKSGLAPINILIKK